VHVLVLASRTTDFSFPSDHAVLAGAVAAALMVGTRGYAGAHLPGDVLAGIRLRVPLIAG
jgi:undecaprenyl-diphosphatase